MSNSAIVRLPQLAWYGDNTIEIDFPSSWDVTVCRSGGEEAAALDGDAFRKAFANPIGTSTIRELARGKKRVAILFDDACRPTPVADILPYVLDELSHAGIEDDDVRFIAALGAHGAMDGVALRKKLGDDVMARFLVYNHNPYELCTPLGTTSRGTPVAINTEVMRCDLKIGIGAIMPHLLTGFSGGPKIILPGVAAIETIGVNHNKWGGPGRTDIGHDEGNVLKADMDEAARMAGLEWRSMSCSTSGERSPRCSWGTWWRSTRRVWLQRRCTTQPSLSATATSSLRIVTSRRTAYPPRRGWPGRC